MHFAGAVGETVFVCLPAIDVDGLAFYLDSILPRQVEGIIGPPMRHVDWIAKDAAEQLRETAGSAELDVHLLRGFGDQRRALSADRAKNIGMGKRRPQRAVGAHG